MKAPIPLAQLGDLMSPGQPLPFRILDGQGRMLLAVGQRVLDVKQLSALLERGACVDHEEAQEVRRQRASTHGVATQGGGYQYAQTWFDSIEKQTWALDGLLRQLGKAPDLVAPLEALADGLVGLLDKHLDAALFLAVRQLEKRYALYALNHALHTATVVLMTARQLAWGLDETHVAVRVALTMNASTVELQARLAEQPDPPSKKQLEQIRAHPQQSAQLLRDSGVTDTRWLDAVQDHHERADGQGYPRGVTEVGEIAHLVRAADVFMAKISPRAMRTALAPQVAARQLFQEEKGGPMAAALIRAVGLYPPGDFVRLKNGEAAVVAHRATATAAALVMAVLGANGKPVPGAPRRDTGQAEFAITGALPDRAGLPRVLPEQVYGVLPA